MEVSSEMSRSIDLCEHRGGGAAPPSRTFLRRYWEAGNLHVDSAKEGSADEVERFPVIAAEADIVGRWVTVNNTAQLLARRIENPDPPCAARINVPRDIHFHAVWIARFAAAQV